MLVWVALAGFLLAIFGTYWDDAWHTVKGRDAFLVPPHIALYAGIALTATALSVWLLGSARREGLRAALSRPAPCVVAAGVALTFVAAPIDNGWHEAFGRDAVIWSPPHMLGVAGALLIAAGLFLELGRGDLRRPVVGSIAAAALVASAAVPVLEYETDVPQFDVAFYLPVLAGASAFALRLVRLLAVNRYAATIAAAAYTIVIALVAAVLAATAMPAPLIPLLVIPALVLDLTARRGILQAGVAFTVAVYAVYVPYLNWIRADVYLEGADLLVGLPVALVAVAAALALTSTQGMRPRAAGAALALTLGVSVVGWAAPSRPALAHDPGQGTELAQVPLEVETDGSRAWIDADLRESGLCGEVNPAGTVARRAGEEVLGPLEEGAQCRFEGTVALPDRGRWFVYAQFDRGGEALETWLPVTAGGPDANSAGARSLYSPPVVTSPPTKTLAGVAAYAMLALAMLGIPLLYRRELRQAGPGP